MRRRKDGTLGPLFINKRQRLELGRIYKAENHPTKGFAVRPGWHICHGMDGAPHLSKKDRVWVEVDFWKAEEIVRPAAQGGVWFLAGYVEFKRVML
jgi:hypothetical protein